MSRTYQVSRTMCCGVAPASLSTAEMFSSASFICATNPCAKRPCASCPIIPPTNTVSPRARMPLAKAFGRGQPGACSIACRVLPSSRIEGSATLVSFSRRTPSRGKLVRGGLARHAAKLEALQLAGLGPRQYRDVFDGAGIFVRGGVGLDVGLQQLGQGRVAGMAGTQHDISLDDLPALRVGRPHHPPFGDPPGGGRGGPDPR